jgi:enterochelin esterase-like enzyme
MNFWQTSAAALRAMFRSRAPQLRQLRHWESETLQRDVDIDMYLPPDYRSNRDRRYPLLLVNDGQDLTRMDFISTLEWLYRENKIPYIIVVAIHAGPDRIREYGTARQPDYKGRGDQATNYKSFILNELYPYLQQRLRITGHPDETAFAGFSLGALSALDIGWDTPEIFGTMGVFSGALWWRWQPVTDEDPDGGRIMHDIIQTSTADLPDNQCFWVQVGTQDEEEDRNNNGIIDAIDDSVDLINALKGRGYPDDQIRYLEVEDGTHDPETWGTAMPDFLIWTFAREQGD